MLWGYHAPTLKMQLWLWPLIAFGLYLLGLLTSLSPVSMISSMSISGMSWLIGLAPLMLVRSRALIADTMLPARADEKFLFYAIYFGLAVPLLVAVTVALLHSVSLAIFGPDKMAEFSAVLSIRLGTISSTYGLGYFSELMGVSATLFGVVAFTRNRALAGVGMNIGAGLALGIIGAIMGIITAFTSGFMDGIRGLEAKNPAIANGEILTGRELETMMNDMMDTSFMSGLVTVTAIITTIGTLIFGYLIYRAIRNRQL